jgi:hypothetical protein
MTERSVVFGFAQEQTVFVLIGSSTLDQFLDFLFTNNVEPIDPVDALALQMRVIEKMRRKLSGSRMSESMCKRQPFHWK